MTLRPEVSGAGWAQGSLWGDKDIFLTENEDLEVAVRGCAHPEKTNRTMSYRTGVKIITLIEAVCESDLCNKPKPGE